MKRVIALVLIVVMVVLLSTGCNGSTEEPETKPQPVTGLSKPDQTKWRYNGEFDIYYQSCIGYCEKPADEQYEQLAVFVPGAYMDANDNGDGTYTCKVSENAELNGYSATTAPILMPIDTPGYAAARALNDEILTQHQGIFEQLSDYTSQGFVLVLSACRGINEGAPAGITDLKAAIRYIRYADDVLAGDAESIFVYGMSGGGAQAAILGASGDSELYAPYLEAIGAVQGVSDAVAGVMAWCPVTNLDTANAEYEWMMGCTRPKRSDELNAISDKLAHAYAEYVNQAGFTDEGGKPMTLTESKEGIYQAGSYYDYVKGLIETSLNHYISDRNLIADSAQDYINSLNTDKNWVIYDKTANTATITSVADFAKHCKIASDQPVAFDGLQGKNTLFGSSEGERSHFDRILAEVLTEMNSEYAADFAADLAKSDSFGNTVETRVNLYSPLYYLMKSREGCGTSNVAKYWRIRSGIEQKTNSLTTEINLALALKSCDRVRAIDFETVWAQNHTEAERSGNSVENAIEWVNTCLKG
nr:tannase [uncultured Ruminococcus sp.]